MSVRPADSARTAPRRVRWRPGGSSVVIAVAVSVLVLLAVLAIFADWIAPYDPLRQNLIEAMQGPSAA